MKEEFTASVKSKLIRFKIRIIMGRTRRRRLRHKRNTSSNLDKDPVVTELKTWMRLNKWQNKSHLLLSHFNTTGRGLCSTKNIVIQDVLIEVPYDIMISLSTLEESQALKNALTTGAKLTIQDLLSIFLILERHKGSKSHWKAYIDSLPKTVPALSWLCAFAEIESIIDPELKAKTKVCYDTFKLSWEHSRQAITYDCVCECCGLPIGYVFDMKSFTWAYVMVNTRCVYVNPVLVHTITGSSSFLDSILLDEPCMALCPYLDMFNHSHDVKTEASLENNNGDWIYKLVTSTSFTKFEELFISYGDHNNIMLLSEYGFFIPDDHLESINYEVDEVVRACNFLLNHRQLSFIKEKYLEDNLEINFEGSSFNLKAILYVFSQPEEKDWAVNIFGGLAFEQTHLNMLLVCLVKFRIDMFLKGLSHVQNVNEAATESFKTIMKYSEFKLNYMKKLLQFLEEKDTFVR